MGDYDPDDPMWVPVDIAARFAEVQTDTIRTWKSRNLIRMNDAGCYSLRDIAAWLDQRNPGKAAGSQRRRGETRSGASLADGLSGL